MNLYQLYELLQTFWPEGALTLGMLKLRAVTSFITLGKDESSWPKILEQAVALNSSVISYCSEAGYTVQSTRLVTNPFGSFLDTSSEESVVASACRLKALAQSASGSTTRLRLALGAAQTPSEVALIPALVRAHGDVANCCVNVAADAATGLVDNDMIELCAAAVLELSRTTPGGVGNFNLTINANCPPGCPFFPASYHLGGSAFFTIGAEYTDLLVKTLREEASKGLSRSAFLDTAMTAMVRAVDAHMAVLAPLLARASTEHGIAFAGLDASAAPSKDCASITDVFALLGCPVFGGAGTLELAALLTRRVFKSIGKSIGLPLTGFSGLMLAALEDVGLAAAAARRDINLNSLLMYSAVCGIGLDTVPIPGDATQAQIAALVRDTAALAFRLDKPLTVRLLNVPGAAAGDMAKFGSPDLCDCTIFAIP